MYLSWARETSVALATGLLTTGPREGAELSVGITLLAGAFHHPYPTLFLPYACSMVVDPTMAIQEA